MVKFIQITDFLLNNCILSVNNNEYRICEIEFYYSSEEHKDSYNHCNKQQLIFGSWYFHRHSNGTLKNGNWKGLDLTLGSENNYLGVLIRSIFNVNTKIITEGPCLVVNKILEENGFNKDDIKNLFQKLNWIIIMY